MAKPDLRDNRKFLKLRRLLGEPTPHVIGYLECLWNRGYQTGNPILGDELDVEAAAEYPNEPKKFAQAAHLAGFLDQDENGRYVIHQLYEHAPKYAKARMTRLGFAPKPSLITDPKKDASKPKPARKRPKKDESKPVPANVGNKTENQEPRTENQEPRTENQKPEENQIPSAAAAAVAATEPNPPIVSPESPTRPRDELFDAIASAAAVDPKTAGGLVAKVAKALRGADPPYTPDDVRQFAAEYGTHCPWGPSNGRDRPTPNEIQTHIGKIRAAPAPSAAAMLPHAKPPPKQLSFTERIVARNAAVLAAATGNAIENAPPETEPLAIETAK